MLSDKDMEQAAGQLASFRTENGRHQITLNEMLEKYSTLIQDYNRLKSDYEEERDSRERYKQLARGQERNPFVLVLIDGDGYVFDDDLVSSGADGGQRAAHLLNRAVKDSLRNHGLDNCRVMVRIYANVSGLSKALSKVKLAGAEKRSLSPFIANFNRSNEMFDFVDAGEMKENADYKIRAMFRQFVENATCKHIYFAGCHDVGYISELMPYVGSRDRISLVRCTAFHNEFSKLGMRIESFPGVFRLTPLDISMVASQQKTLPTRSTEVPAAPGTENVTVCKFYSTGRCTYGASCRNLHVPSPQTSSKKSANGASLADIRDWRNVTTNQSDGPFSLSNLAKKDNEFFMGGARATSDPPMHSSSDFCAALPRAEDVPPGDVLVNKKQHRLDTYMPQANQEEWTAFNARAARHKLCNNYHLIGECSKASDCQYDHSPISPPIMKCLRLIARNLPCGRRGDCRIYACIQGHICQRPDCKHNGGKAYCRLPYTAHIQDLHVAQYVSGVAQQSASLDEVDNNTTANGKGSSPSLLDSRSMAADSDDEKHDGAPLDLNHADTLD